MNGGVANEGRARHKAVVGKRFGVQIMLVEAKLVSRYYDSGDREAFENGRTRHGQISFSVKQQKTWQQEQHK